MDPFGAPPSWRPAAGYGDRLDRSRGEVSEALISILNLSQLLRSLRAGPKALHAAVADALAATATLEQGMLHLDEDLARRDPRTMPALAQLDACWNPKVAGLRSALESNDASQARGRLSLDQQVAEAWAELDAVGGLYDLLVTACWGARTQVELDSLLLTSDAYLDRWRPGEGKLEVGALPLGGAVELSTKPKAALRLVSLAVSFEAAAGRAPTLLRTWAGRGGRCGVELLEGEGSRSMTLPLQRILPCTLSTMQAAASVVDVDLKVGEASGVRALSWLQV